jgi:hypothetical protein
MKSGLLFNRSRVSVAGVPAKDAANDVTLNTSVNGGCTEPNRGISKLWTIGVPPASEYVTSKVSVMPGLRFPVISTVKVI